MKLTIFSLICLFVIFAFAGVQPMASYKDKSFSYISSASESSLRPIVETPKPVPTPTPTVPAVIQTPKVVIPTPLPTQPNLRNPSWEELKDFLLVDKTDQIKYVFPTFVCENFAKTLQANAKKMGWRCALVSVRLNGYPDWFNYGIPSNTGHACNAFETTDMGLVYIDDTGLPANFQGQGSCDKIVDIKVGQDYVPRNIFPSLWYWADMGTVVDIETIQW